MILRIVRMEFQADKVNDFLEVFESSRNQIRNFPGVHHLELCRDAELNNVYFTVSKWESADALETYRTSELFASVWNRTKILFSGKPYAWSLLQG